MAITLTCQTEWKILFDFLKRVVRENDMGGSTQIKGVMKFYRALFNFNINY